MLTDQQFNKLKDDGELSVLSGDGPFSVEDMNEAASRLNVHPSRLLVQGTGHGSFKIKRV